MEFPLASQPHIVRSAQKDEFYGGVLYNAFYDAFAAVFGSRAVIRSQKDIQWLSAFVYFWLTTWRGLPTLGEEYCDIRRVVLQPTQEGTTQPTPQREGAPEAPTPEISVPTQKSRCLMLICELILPYWFEKFFTWLSIISQPRHSGRSEWEWVARQDVKDRLQRIVTVIGDVKATFQRIHLAIFYLQGYFFHFLKRLSSTGYIFNHIPKDKQAPYQILGVLLFLQLGITLLSKVPRLFFRGKKQNSQVEVSPDEEEDEESEERCTLCLEPRKATTATACGHLFCWECIHEACQVKPECPLCRQTIESRTLMRINHYP